MEIPSGEVLEAMSGAPKGNAGGSYFVADLGEQMAHYDALPEEARRVIGAAPAPIDVRQMTQILEVFGLERGIELAVRVLEGTYQGWCAARDIEQNIRRPRRRARG